MRGINMVENSPSFDMSTNSNGNKKITYEEAVASILPGKYRHYKGNEYGVICIVRHSETTEPMVVYRALYGDHGVWVRPAYM